MPSDFIRAQVAAHERAKMCPLSEKRRHYLLVLSRLKSFR